MRSINKLKISGTVVSEFFPIPGKSSIRFTIAHYFGGGRQPLYLPCVCSPETAAEVHKNIVITAYIRASKVGVVEAFVTNIENLK